jgi:hypothetical protein
MYSGSIVLCAEKTPSDGFATFAIGTAIAVEMLLAALALTVLTFMRMEAQTAAVLRALA